MGPDRRERAGYSESHETMVTGALSKKATFATTARKSKGNDTPFYHKREVTRIQEKSPERFQERIAQAGTIRNAVAQTRSDQTLQQILGDIESKSIDEKRRIIRSELTQQNLEKDTLERLAAELGLQPAYRKAKGYYQEMVDEYHREHERKTRYDNRLKRMDGLDGYCYLKMYKRRYQPYAHLLYGRYPKLGNLNLQEEYLSEIFDNLNICVNYENQLFHVYWMLNVTYQPGYEKVVGNRRMIGDEWHAEFHVGATQTQTESSRTQQQQQPQQGSDAFDMR